MRKILYPRRMTWKLFIQITIIALLTTVVIQQATIIRHNTSYLNADWCSSEIDTLRKHVDEIHTVLIGDQEVTPK